MIVHDPNCPCLICDNRRKMWAAAFEQQRANLEQSARERETRPSDRR